VEPHDVVVIGGGMAGVSIGAELAADRRVVVLDMEPTLAFHTTGRSAAMFLESYGGPAVRALTTASRTFLLRCEVLRSLPMLHLGLTGRGAAIEALFAAVRPLLPDAELLDPPAAARLQPMLRADAIELALLEPGAMEIDVHALHQHYVHTLRARGGAVAVSAGVAGAVRAEGRWTVIDRTGRQWDAPVVVDAAGAWADDIAVLFGAAPVGLRPLRRTAFMVDAPAGAAAPMIADIDNSFYVKPDAGRLLCSPADETPQPPADARPDELEIARALDVINTVTTLDVRHVRSAWAGLRTFAADRTPVAGPDPAVEGFFWFAGQGGYGIQIAPALARTAADMLRGRPVPDDVAAVGLRVADLAPERFRNAGPAGRG
jgi:D-arginine dehydrogenase